MSCLHMAGSPPALYASNAIFLLLAGLSLIASYLFEEDATSIFGPLFGFGLCAIYTLKKIKSLEDTEQQQSISVTIKEEEKRENVDVHTPLTPLTSDTIHTKEIEIENIFDAM